MKVTKLEGICRCGSVLNKDGLPCDHCDSPCLLRNCKKCKRLLDTNSDKLYYAYES